MTTVAERSRFPQVLLVEDNRGDAVLVRMAFKRAKMPGHISVAGTAEIALSMLRLEGEHAEALRPDLVLLDLNLPYMHGLSFLRVVKAERGLAAIPVIILSSSSAEGDVTASYEGHANGFVTKPISLDDYDDVVTSIGDYWFKLVQTPACR